MKTVSGLSQLPLDVSGSVATLGMFDGVHRGHQAVIDCALSRARTAGLTTVAVTFASHPDAELTGSVTPMLTSLRYRLVLLERQGVDFCLVLDFTRELAAMTAGEFVAKVFVEGLRAKAVVVGFDCRFGHNREGDAGFLASQGKARGFEVESVGSVEAAGERISSTAIRRLVAKGDFEAVREMLGRPYSIMGPVVSGAHRGSGLGFPTANMGGLEGVVLPPEGVYVADAILGAKEYQALVSVGNRPTFDDKTGVVVEAYLLDCEGELYGQELELEFLRLVRPQRRYGSGAELKTQMEKDLEYAKRYFAGDLEG
jgi:riboflavin kinase / FMN adenylyltransferase